MNERIDVLAVMDETGSVIRSRLSHYNRKAAKGCTHPETLVKQDRAVYLIGANKEARAAVAELIEEHAAMRELLRIQDEAMTAYRELVEHRNRQIYALGGEL